MPLVQLITDLTTVSEAELLRRIAAVAALSPEARARFSVQLRDPQLSTRELLRLGSELRRITRGLGAKLIVNDRVDLAAWLEADGVHLGRGSMSVADARSLLGPGASVATSAHSVSEVVAAARLGASAALLSPIFASPGKGPPLGLAAIAAARRALERSGLSLQLLALGGVTPADVASCSAAGASGVAAIRADLASALVEG